jgi:hypothetical protein
MNRDWIITYALFAVAIVLGIAAVVMQLMNL